MAKTPWPSSLMPDQRVEAARRMSRSLVDHVIGLIQLNEANRLIVYSDTLSSQIPESFAAHAFNQFQRSSHFFELLRLCAIWEGAAPNRESLPTIAMLIDNPDVTAILASDISSAWTGRFTPSGLGAEADQALLANERGFGVLQARRLIRSSQRATAVIKSVELSRRLANLRNFRDKSIAHNLVETYAEAKGKVFEGPKFGHEGRLLRLTVHLVNALYLGVCNTDFAFYGSKNFARKNAEALWRGCRFDVLE